MRLRQQFLTKTERYIQSRTMAPKGIMVHSTGANNPRLSRYVPKWDVYHPGGRDIGPHQYTSSGGRCLRCGGRRVAVHAFIGKDGDGEIASVQTLPWTRKGWHGGGESNESYIGFEICEDGLTDRAYFRAVYQEAVELTAHLCQEFGLDPMADGAVICHSEGYRRGLASNHADVMHWFPKHGKSMDDFRADVARVIRESEEGEKVTQEQFDRMMGDWLSRQAEKPVSDWARGLIEDAKARGLTDGTRPQSFATRQEVAVMVRAAT